MFPKICYQKVHKMIIIIYIFIRRYSVEICTKISSATAIFFFNLWRSVVEMRTKEKKDIISFISGETRRKLKCCVAHRSACDVVNAMLCTLLLNFPFKLPLRFSNFYMFNRNAKRLCCVLLLLRTTLLSERCFRNPDLIRIFGFIHEIWRVILCRYKRIWKGIS